MTERDGVRFTTGVGLAIVGLPLYLSVALWKSVKPHLNSRFLQTLNGVATDARWWSVMIMGVLVIVTFSRFFEEKRWPYSLARVSVEMKKDIPREVPVLQELSLKAALAADYPGTWQNWADFTLRIDGKDVVVRVIDFRNAHDGSEFLGAYIPITSQAFEIAKDIITHHAELLSKIGKGGIETRAEGQVGEESANNVVFTKRLYIYHDADFTLAQKMQLEYISNSLGITTIFRSSAYLATEKWKIPDTPKKTH